MATLLLVGCSGCYKVATDDSGCGFDYAPYSGSVPLNIRGVHPGQAENDVISLLGPPDRRLDSGYRIVSLQWQRFGNMVVTLDAAGRVTEVLGDELAAGADAVVQHGMSEADVRHVPGNAAKSQNHYRPSGSGVISLSRKRARGTLSHLRDGSTIEITLLENGVAYIRLAPPRNGGSDSNPESRVPSSRLPSPDSFFASLGHLGHCSLLHQRKNAPSLFSRSQRRRTCDEEKRNRFGSRSLERFRRRHWTRS